MLNTRIFKRGCISATCEIYNDKSEKIADAEILNLSQGGLLITKTSELENLTLDKFLVISLKNKNNQPFTVYGVVLRIQERSIAIKFNGLNEMQTENIFKLSQETQQEQKLCSK